MQPLRVWISTQWLRCSGIEQLEKTVLTIAFKNE